MPNVAYANMTFSVHLFKGSLVHFPLRRTDYSLTSSDAYWPMICLLFLFINHTKADIGSKHLSLTLQSFPLDPDCPVWISALPLITVGLGKLIEFFSLLQNGDDKIVPTTKSYLSVQSLLWWFSDLIFVKHCKQCLVHRQCLINISCYFYPMRYINMRRGWKLRFLLGPEMWNKWLMMGPRANWRVHSLSEIFQSLSAV